MIYRGFCGPSNPSQSVQADCERTINFYPERVESPAAPTDMALYPTPGFQSKLTLADVGARSSIFSMAGRSFVVSGSGFYELFSTWTSIKRGVVAQDNYPATISYNGATGAQLGITSGGNWYNFQLATNVLTQVAALNGKATMGGMLNSRFLAFDINTSTVYASALNDGTTWVTGTMYFTRSLAPDPWQAMVVAPPVIFLIGEQTGEAWYDSGAFPQPFAPYPGAFFQYGTPAPFSAGVAGDAVTWLSRTAAGQGIIVAARGYTPQKISNYAVETALSSYARNSVNSLANAEILVYQQEGHLFAAYSFPDGPGTWVVNMDTGQWHERGFWNTATAQWEIWHPRVYGYAFNTHLVGERGSGKIAAMDVTFGTEIGETPIRRIRVGPPLWASSRERLVVSRFELLAQAGLGLVGGQGSNPLVMFESSPDAQTWGTQRMASAGPMGKYGHRCFWTRCGSSDKLWTPRITVSDPIPWRLSGAQIDGSGFSQTTARAA